LIKKETIHNFLPRPHEWLAHRKLISMR